MEHVNQVFPNGLPSLEQIKERNEGSDLPVETAWIWGENDEIGRINLLHPARVMKVKETEIRVGQIISLNWSMNLPEKPAFGRDPCRHTIKNHPDGNMVFDDWIDMNIQSGSQWDGFRHFGHQSGEVFYNGLKPHEVLKGNKCGIQALSNHGIVGRGVLLDYYDWKLNVKGERYDPSTSHAIHLDELQRVAEYEGLHFEAGDILLIRSGYISAYYEYQKTDPKRLDVAGSFKPSLAGVAQTEEMKTWLHDNYFSAVAGDAPAWECWPSSQPWFLHEFLLGCWGVPIGEMFDLEALGEQCRRKKRWTFCFTSSPINMPGGIASLANAMVIM